MSADPNKPVDASQVIRDETQSKTQLEQQIAELNQQCAERDVTIADLQFECDSAQNDVVRAAQAHRQLREQMAQREEKFQVLEGLRVDLREAEIVAECRDQDMALVYIEYRKLKNRVAEQEKQIEALRSRLRVADRTGGEATPPVTEVRVLRDRIRDQEQEMERLRVQRSEALALVDSREQDMELAYAEHRRAKEKLVEQEKEIARMRSRLSITERS